MGMEPSSVNFELEGSPGSHSWNGSDLIIDHLVDAEQIYTTEVEASLMFLSFTL